MEEYEQLIICAKCKEEFSDYGDIVFDANDQPLCSQCGWGCPSDQLSFLYDDEWDQ